MSQDFKPSMEVDFDDALNGLKSFARYMGLEMDGEHKKQWAEIEKLLGQAHSKYSEIIEEW